MKTAAKPIHLTAAALATTVALTLGLATTHTSSSSQRKANIMIPSVWRRWSGLSSAPVLLAMHPIVAPHLVPSAMTV